MHGHGPLAVRQSCEPVRVNTLSPPPARRTVCCEAWRHTCGAWSRPVCPTRTATAAAFPRTWQSSPWPTSWIPYSRNLLMVQFCSGPGESRDRFVPPRGLRLAVGWLASLAVSDLPHTQPAVFTACRARMACRVGWEPFHGALEPGAADPASPPDGVRFHVWRPGNPRRDNVTAKLSTTPRPPDRQARAARPGPPESHPEGNLGPPISGAERRHVPSLPGASVASRRFRHTSGIPARSTVAARVRCGGRGPAP